MTKPILTARKTLKQIVKRIQKENDRLNNDEDSSWRRYTANLRLRPSFMIIGAAKAGTSSLYLNLCAHSWMQGASTKELHFFERQYDKGAQWYAMQFPLPALRDALTPRSENPTFITGEATPGYLFFPYVPQRIFEMFPDQKFVVLLRDPSKRAYSHAAMEDRSGIFAVADPDDALRQELDFFETKSIDRALFERCFYDWVKARQISAYPQAEYRAKSSEALSLPPVPYEFLLRSLYYEQLSIWFEYYPRQQFLILKSEDYFADPMHYVNEVIPAFLDMPKGSLSTYSRSKQETHKPYKTDPALQSRLAEFFKPYNEKLYNLLGVDFGW